MKISNKTILITGATDGIGKVLAIEFSKLGSNIILLGRDASKLDKVYVCISCDYNIFPVFHCISLTFSYCISSSVSIFSARSASTTVSSGASTTSASSISGRFARVGLDITHSLLSRCCVGYGLLLVNLCTYDLR